MKTEKTTQNIRCAVYSGSLALTLASIIAAAMLALPAVGILTAGIQSLSTDQPEDYIVGC